MIGLSYSEFIAVLAGLAFGIIGGAAIITQTEINIRKRDEARSSAGALRALLLGIFRVAVVGFLMIIVVMAILRASGVYALTGNLLKIFIAAGLAGAAAGKYMRYWYWRRRAN